MKRFFLTGCSGWIGIAIVRELCRRQDIERIVLLTRNPQLRFPLYSFDKRIQLYEGDINSVRFPTDEFTHIIHGANPPVSAEPQAVYYAIVNGTERILEWAGKRGIANFLLISSGAARGEPTSAYGRGKRMAERLCSEKNAYIARLFTLIGEGVPLQYAAGEFIYQATFNGRVRCEGGEGVQRSYLHVDDAARWMLRIMDEGQRALPYDVGAPMPYTIDAVARLIANKWGVPFVHVPDPAKQDSYLPDLRHTLRLGCNTTIQLGTALERIRDNDVFRNPRLESPKAT